MEIDAFQERSIASVIGPENGFAGKKRKKYVVRASCVVAASFLYRATKIFFL